MGRRVKLTKGADETLLDPTPGRDLLPGDFLISVDPGKTTGLCVGRYTGAPSRFDFDLVGAYEVPWDDRFFFKHVLANTMQAGPLFRVIVEKFVLYEAKKNDLVYDDMPSSMFTGMVHAYLHEADALNLLVYQLAAWRVGTEVLPVHKKALGSSPHITDAYKHLRYYIVSRLWQPTPQG